MRNTPAWKRGSTQACCSCQITKSHHRNASEGGPCPVFRSAIDPLTRALELVPTLTVYSSPSQPHPHHKKSDIGVQSHVLTSQLTISALANGICQWHVLSEYDRRLRQPRREDSCEGPASACITRCFGVYLPRPETSCCRRRNTAAKWGTKCLMIWRNESVGAISSHLFAIDVRN